MKKILIVFDGEHFPVEAMRLAVALNEQSEVLVTGAFVPSVEYTNLIYYMGGMEGYYFNTIEDIEGDTKAIAANIKRFREYSVQQGLEFRVHSNLRGTALDAIVLESRFSDLLLLSGDVFYSNMSERMHNERLDDTAEMAECPVLILPQGNALPRSVILAYDGSESSVFAIKQFAYLLPEFAKLKTTIIYIDDEEKEIPYFDNISELATRHFPNLDFNKVDADPKVYFDTWMSNEKGSLFVTGSYGRTMLSRLFKKSFVKDLLHENKLPIFIAHK